MPDLDAGVLRNAIDLASGGGPTAPLGKISSIYKALTPGTKDVRVSLDSLREAGFTLETRDFKVFVTRQDDGRPRFAPDGEELLRLAYRFALAGTNGAPRAEWAEFSLFSSGLHMLSPEAKAGKKLRNELDRHPLWRIVSHTFKKTVTRYTRVEMRDGKPVMCEGDHDSWEMREQCGKEDERAEEETYVQHDAHPTIYIRPREDAEQPRTVTLLLPDGGRRLGWKTSGMKGIWEMIRREVPAFIIEDGTRLEIRREPDGKVDTVITFSREKEQWLLPDGHPMPREVWDGDNYVRADDLTDAQKADLLPEESL